MSDATPGTQRWEYAQLCRQTEKNLVFALNKLGVLGWEAISISFNQDLKGVWAWTAFIKRPLAPGAEPSGDILEVLDGTVTEGQGPKKALAGFDLTAGDFGLKD
jgi:hypothetical protein